MGDVNMNARKETEQDAYRTWLGEEQLWELSSARRPTYVTGPVADRVWLARGRYLPGRTIPRNAEKGDGGNFPTDYPVVVTAEKAPADHHALTLDLTTLEQPRMLRIERYNINTLPTEGWEKKKAAITGDTRGIALRKRLQTSTNVQRHYQEIATRVRSHLKDRLAVTRKQKRANATEAFDKRYSDHAPSEDY